MATSKKHSAGAKRHHHSPSPKARKKYAALVTKAAERTLIATAKHDKVAARSIINKAERYL